MSGVCVMRYGGLVFDVMCVSVVCVCVCVMCARCVYGCGMCVVRFV